MGGGLMQLVAYGAQDVYLTGNPQITFFKVVYRRHTNFACEAIEQTFNGTPALGGKATVPITRNGDLVTKMWLKTSVSNSVAVIAPTSTGADSLVELGNPTQATYTANGGNTIAIEATGNNTIELTLASSAALTVAAAAGDILVLSGSAAGDYAGNYYVVGAESIGATTIELVALASKGITNTTPDVGAQGSYLAYAVHGNATTFTWNTDLGYALISSVELQIGGTKIDKHYGRWMHVWSQLTRTSEHLDAHNQMINPAGLTATASPSLYVPLQFFCCRNDGLALPLIALQYHDVRLEFDFAAAASVASSGTNVSLGTNTNLLVNYIYLDSEERKRFAQASHEYLIEQLQFTGVETVGTSKAEKVRLNFNHPVKELIWAQESAWGTFSSVTDSLLQLNGHDRFSAQPGKFFNYVQPHTHHTRAPSAGINVYSFALNPEEHQPSGTCNFSRIDNATLTVNTGAAGTSLYVYGVNYNVLRVMSGMGGVAYSN